MLWHKEKNGFEPGITLRSLAASLLCIVLAAVYTNYSCAFLNEHRQIVNQAIPIPAMLAVLFSTLMVGLMALLTRRRIFTRAELVCVAFATMMAAPLMSDGLWQRFFGIIASVPRAGATLLSTIYPAMTAMEIAKPADNAGWSLPAPEADGRLSFTLPFTFTHRDRIAVLAFLHDYFDSFGEGSAGVFFSGPPGLRVSDRLDKLADGAYIPELKARIWLKPFDLGVSQDVEIELGTDPDTREYIAQTTITRVTGTLDSWYRLNRPFVAAVRRQFLHWRAVGEAQKADLFVRARSLLQRG